MTQPAPVEYEKVVTLIEDLLGPHFHQKQCLSIANAVVGAMHADRLSVAAVGRALAAERGMNPKHGIKQVDRLLSNSKIDVETSFAATVPWNVGARKNIVVVMDWTEYAPDGHSRIAINLVTEHGRATPLVWRTIRSCDLKDQRNDYEDDLFRLLKSVLPKGVHVTVLADRGFGDASLYTFLKKQLGFDFVIRFRGCIKVQGESGEARQAEDWLPADGHAIRLPNVRVTARRVPVEAVVCVHEKGMKDAWYLATSLPDSAKVIIELYGRRFTIEENFRDEKDRRFGLGLIETQIGTPVRRDRFLLVAHLAMILLTLLGAAGERIGLDRMLRANTETRRRTHSLFRQGREYLSGVANRALKPLRRVFWKLVRNTPKNRMTYSLI